MSHEANTAGCGLHPIHRGCGTVRKHVWLRWHTSQLASWGDLCLLLLEVSKKKPVFFLNGIYGSSRKDNQVFLCVCLFYLHRIPLIRFKSIKKQLKEKGELEEFWRSHHPDVFARRYLHCFPADIALSVGAASERLYDYMNVSTVLVMQSLGLIILLKAGFFSQHILNLVCQ